MLQIANSQNAGKRLFEALTLNSRTEGEMICNELVTTNISCDIVVLDTRNIFFLMGYDITNKKLPFILQLKL